MSEMMLIGYDGELCTVRTKPCWICGQHGEVKMSTEAFNRLGAEVHPAVAWPEGTNEQHILLITGTHQKCWDEEFPEIPFETQLEDNK